jgi:hypothetical protein
VCVKFRLLDRIEQEAKCQSHIRFTFTNYTQVETQCKPLIFHVEYIFCTMLVLSYTATDERTVIAEGRSTSLPAAGFNVLPPR